MNYIIIALFSLAISLAIISTYWFIEYRKIKKTVESSINDLQAKLDKAVEEREAKLDKAIEEREAKLNEIVNLLGNADQFLVQYFSLPLLEEKLASSEYPEMLDFEVQFPINPYYEGQKIRLQNGMEYTITRTGKRIRVEKS